MELFIIIIIGIILFMFSVYFTRWIFGIDKIIENQKEQSRLLKSILESVSNISNSRLNLVVNPLDINTKSQIMDDKTRCPACSSVLKENEVECSNCGLVVR